MLHKAPQAFLHFMKIIHPKFGNGDSEKEKKKNEAIVWNTEDNGIKYL